jgi:hypothetical protein
VIGAAEIVGASIGYLLIGVCVGAAWVRVLGEDHKGTIKYAARTGDWSEKDRSDFPSPLAAILAVALWPLEAIVGILAGPFLLCSKALVYLIQASSDSKELTP